MLKTRVIPTLLWKDIGLVKGLGFDSWRRVGSVLPAVKVYNLRDVDELILVDVRATLEGRQLDSEALEEIVAECFVPLTVGGGVRSVEDVRTLLEAGADKVCINSALYTDEHLLGKAAERFGAQCMVASMDVRRDNSGQALCYSHCGSVATGRDPVEWARLLEKKGAGEILLTSIDRDGMMTGYDIELALAVSEAVKIPVIISGGAAGYADFEKVLKSTRVSAVAAASMFHFTEQTPAEAKRYLKGVGIPVRL